MIMILFVFCFVIVVCFLEDMFCIFMEEIGFWWFFFMYSVF